MLEFSDLGMEAKNEVIFGNANPLENGANTTDPRALALMSRVGGPSGKRSGFDGDATPGGSSSTGGNGPPDKTTPGNGRRLSDSDSVIAYTVTLGGDVATQLGSDIYGEVRCMR